MLAPGQVVDKYEIVERLGGGGMAQVYKVRHTLLGSYHALKVLDSQLVSNEDLRMRFLAEGQIQAKLRHPNIVAVTDIVATTQIAGLVVEFVDGPTLDEVILSMNQRPGADAVKTIFLPLLAALGYAHKQGVVHRDVKPSNIIVEQLSDGTLVPKLFDFGIAKLGESALGPDQAKGQTRTGMQMGTANYMSPEQIRAVPDIDHRTDIFSLAATMYEFVAKKTPFEALSDFDTMRLIVDGHATGIREFAPDVDPVLEFCIRKGLFKDREGRFQSCEEFSEALKKAGTNAKVRDMGPDPALAMQPRPYEQRIEHYGSGPIPYQAPSPYQASSEGDWNASLIQPDPSISPMSNALLNLCCISGMGQMANGQAGKAALVFFGSVLLGVITGGASVFVTYPLAAIDAYKIASKLKSGQPVGHWDWF